MKKLELTAVANFLRTLPADTTFPNPAYNGESHITPEFSIKDILEMMDTELNRGAAEREAKAAAYEAARPVVFEAMRVIGAPATVADIFTEAENELPEGFSKNKVQYGLLHYWNDSVVKTEGKVNMYAIK